MLKSLVLDYGCSLCKKNDGERVAQGGGRNEESEDNDENQGKKREQGTTVVPWQG